jgi:hypothetical protein
MQNNYDQYKYTVNNTTDFSLTDALRLWKTKYSDIKDFDKEVITHPGLSDFAEFVHEMWNDIVPFTVQDALAMQNQEVRRCYFHCIGVEKLFKEMKPKLLDKQVVKKKRMRWDDKNDPYEYNFEDVYELYQIDGKMLFEKTEWGAEPAPVYAVRCWCTTTNREYWIYVTDEAAVNKAFSRWSTNDKKEEPDAIRAIAWTIRLDIENPERIYRQGDIIVAKTIGESEKIVPLYHLSKDQYLSLMYSET